MTQKEDQNPMASRSNIAHEEFNVDSVIGLIQCRGDAEKFGSISITYHKYILGVYKYKYIVRLEISTFDRENC